MSLTTRISAVLIALLVAASGVLVETSRRASSQSSPGLVQGQIPTAAQWNSYFAAKQDFTGGSQVSITGGTLSGKLTTVTSSASGPSFNVPPGVAPSAPTNGDFWTTSAGVFARVNGSTANLTSAATGLSTTGGTMTGELVTAVPTLASAMLGLPHGASPTTPVNGDLWTTTGGLFARINGATFNLTTITAGQLPAFGSGDVSFASGGGAGTIAAGAVTRAKMATATQNTIVGSATSTSAADLTMPSCSTATSALTWTTNTGFGCNTLSTGTTTGVQRQVFTSSGTFTIPASTVSTTLFKFTITGGGASGGTAAVGAGGAGGGGAGGTAINFLSGITAGSTITVTVGAAGVASSISSGTQSITTVTGAAGSGGGAGGGGAGGGGGSGGSTTNAEISIPGGDGYPGDNDDPNASNGNTSGSGGNGGGSIWGLGGAGGQSVNSGNTGGGTAARAFGAGGGGGGSGGAGKSGIVLVEWVL